MTWAQLSPKYAALQRQDHPLILILCYQAWFYWNEAEKVLVLAFPGTETIEEMAEDAATGNNAATEKLGDIASEVSHPKLEVDIENSTSKVHKGYKDAYLSIRDILLDIVYSVTKWSKDWLIIVTGHSDGGSIAALAAYDIATKKYMMLALIVWTLLFA